MINPLIFRLVDIRGYKAQINRIGDEEWSSLITTSINGIKFTFVKRGRFYPFLTDILQSRIVANQKIRIVVKCSS